MFSNLSLPFPSLWHATTFLMLVCSSVSSDPKKKSLFGIFLSFKTFKTLF